MEITLLASLLDFISRNPESIWATVAMVSLLVLTFLVLASTLLLKLVTNTSQLTKRMSKTKSKQDWDEGIRSSKHIADFLRSIKHDNFADRVSLIQLHNGEHSINGLDHYKFTLTDQETVETVTPTIESLRKGMPLSMLIDVIHAIGIEKQTSVCIPDISKTMHDHNLRTFRSIYFTPNGTKSVYFFPVVDAYGYFFAVGMVEYVNQPHDMHDKRVRYIEREFLRLGGVLTIDRRECKKPLLERLKDVFK